jgi:hypothetical protein
MMEGKKQQAPSKKIAVHTMNMGTAFDIDVNKQEVIAEEKMFNLDLHIRTLEKDIADISSFASVLDQVLGRTTQRKKEYLGRRVWAGKNIYLSTEDKRLIVSRERWQDIVRFRARRNLIARARFLTLRPLTKDAAPHLQVQPHRSLSTLAPSSLNTTESSRSTPLLSKIRSFLPS